MPALPHAHPSIPSPANFGAYELEEDTVKDLAEFSLANAIYAALVEGHAAEINSKRNAMDNASKNAGDMISNLQMQYNRGRQATIVSSARRTQRERQAMLTSVAGTDQRAGRHYHWCLGALKHAPARRLPHVARGRTVHHGQHRPVWLL